MACCKHKAAHKPEIELEPPDSKLDTLTTKPPFVFLSI